VIVLDASVVVTGLLVAGPAGAAAREVLRSGPLHVPHLLDVEVTSAVRRWVLSGRLSVEHARMSLLDLRDLAADRHAHEPLLDRVLDLRDALSAYDAMYVALAELLGTSLVTGDQRLARAPGILCPVTLLSALSE
jgi:predicted nucleic acid-binding protein